MYAGQYISHCRWRCLILIEVTMMVVVVFVDVVLTVFGGGWLDSLIQWMDLKLTALEEQNGHLTQVKIDKVARFMCNIGTEIPSDNTMPCWVVFLVKFLLDICGNVLK